LRTDIDRAEKIKLAYVKAHSSKVNMNEKIRIEELEGDEAMVTRKELQRIADARLDEIFSLVRAELKKIGKDSMLPGGVVLTGGGAKMAGIEELAKEKLHLPAIVGKPEGFTGIVDRISDPAFAAPIGLMLENMSQAAVYAPSNAKIGQTVDRIKKTLRNLLP
jgi:cell division protein FtsA